MFDRATAIRQIRAGNCSCAGCPGQLTDPAKSKGGWAFCKTCACAWQTTRVNLTVYASTIPSAVHRPLTPAKTAGN